MKRYEESTIPLSDSVVATCYYDGPDRKIARCHVISKNREGGWDEVFIVSSEKIGKDKFKEKIEFTNVGMNLIRDTPLEHELWDSGKNYLEFT